ncbi:hypothetical protein C2845_PM10G00170 [Panicum miliaceum]|uniref:Uncharacterized protein n=1 Tax=Panicum miliaceum TaxID=4540 RepID=A0A3L6PGX5_PANMI|nr:hypothetical protein C2845_PM10G00170 [Panicum miliaceum]
MDNRDPQEKRNSVFSPSSDGREAMVEKALSRRGTCLQRLEHPQPLVRIRRKTKGGGGIDDGWRAAAAAMEVPAREQSAEFGKRTAGLRIQRSRWTPLACRVWNSRVNSTVLTCIWLNIWKCSNAKMFRHEDEANIKISRRCRDDLLLWSNRC